MHVALAQQAPRAALAVMVAIVGAVLTYRIRSLTARLAAMVGVGALLVLVVSAPAEVPLDWLIFLPPILINLALLIVFGRTLRPGRQPLIATIAKLERGRELPADLAAHAGRLTWVWVGFFAVMTLMALLLAIFAPLRTWSFWTNVVNPLLIVILFVGEYVYRKLRYSQYRHATPLRVLQLMRPVNTLHLAVAPSAVENIPLLPLHSPQDSLAWRNGRPVTASEFMDAATAIAALLPGRRYVLNLCKDRYHFMVGFAAAMARGQTSLFPPGCGEATIHELYAGFDDACCIADHTDVPAGIEVIDIGAGIGGARRDGAGGRDFAFSPKQTAAVVFTSGSTGRPVSHGKTWGSLVRGAEALGGRLRLDSAAPPQIEGTVPPQHMFGLESTVLLPMRWGGAVDAGCPLLPGDTRTRLAALPAPRWLMTTPVHLRAMAMEEVDGPDRLAGIISSTMPLDVQLARRIESQFACPVLEIYGSTETGAVAMRRTVDDESWALLSGLEIEIENECAWVYGGHVERRTRLADRIRMQSDGRFSLVGRDTDLVKVAGKRASLEELNQRLRRIPGVIDGLYFFSEPEGSRILRPVAFAVAPGKTADEIIAGLRESLDPVFIPRPLYLVEALPRAANGKITRQSLEDLADKVSAASRPAAPESR